MSTRRFTTDQQGNLPAGTRLLPNTTYVLLLSHKPVQRLESHRDLASWIEECVLGDLRTLQLGMDARQSGSVSQPEHPLGGGNFLLLARLPGGA